MCQPNATEQQQNHNRKKTLPQFFILLHFYGLDFDNCYECFEKVLKTTSNITAPFDEDENMHTRQPFLKKVCFCSFRHPLKYCNYCSLKMKIKKLIHFQD